MGAPTGWDIYYEVGLAVSEDGGSSFTRVQQSPVLSRSEFDPWLVTALDVFKSGEKWLMADDGYKIFLIRTSRYDLKIADLTISLIGNKLEKPRFHSKTTRQIVHFNRPEIERNLSPLVFRETKREPYKPDTRDPRTV